MPLRTGEPRRERVRVAEPSGKRLVHRAGSRRETVGRGVFQKAFDGNAATACEARERRACQLAWNRMPFFPAIHRADGDAECVCELFLREAEAASEIANDGCESIHVCMPSSPVGSKTNATALARVHAGLRADPLRNPPQK